MLKPLTYAPYFDVFNKFSAYCLARRGHMTSRVFSYNLEKVKGSFCRWHQQDFFCEQASKLADDFCESGDFGYAGVIYSCIIKLCKDRTLFEKIVRKAYQIAESQGDYIHMNARLNDLRRIYDSRPGKTRYHIDVLFKQEKCLEHLVHFYGQSVEHFRTISTRAADFDTYNLMLAYVRTTLAKLTWKNDPFEAKVRLLASRCVYKNCGDDKSVQYVNYLLKRIHDFEVLQKNDNLCKKSLNIVNK